MSHLYLQRLRYAAYSTVSCGRATPVLVNVSQPANRSINSGLGISDPSASMAVLAACHVLAWEAKNHEKEHTGITSRPIPSAGMRPIFKVFLAVVEKDLRAGRSILLSVTVVAGLLPQCQCLRSMRLQSYENQSAVTAEGTGRGTCKVSLILILKQT
jgi:hypothetical protein